jgi:DNA-binding GntR family transcriptional regulator
MERGVDDILSHDIGRAIPEHLATLLEWEIISGGLAPGARLTEEDVAATYGVSRSPVREGLRLLERDGLVRRSARRGIWVASLSLSDFDEVYQCRVALEALAAERAARSPDAARSDESSRLLLRRLEDAHDRGDIPALFRADVEASKLIYLLTGNLTLQRLLTGLEKQALRYRFFAYAKSPKVVAMSLDGSRQIWTHICRGDAELARDLTSALIREIWLTMRPGIADAFPEKP